MPIRAVMTANNTIPAEEFMQMISFECDQSRIFADSIAFCRDSLHAGLEPFDSDSVYAEMAAHSIWAGAPVQAFNEEHRGQIYFSQAQILELIPFVNQKKKS